MIDARAAIDPGARLAPGVSVGPWSIIGPEVEIGEGTWIGPHTVIKGPTRIGRNNKIFQFASIGDDPQDKKYAGQRTYLEIGDGNVIRECCTLNWGTLEGGGVTRVGDSNWIMAYCHIAHDCQVGNETIFANNASLAGHVTVGDYAILGGFSGVHQFVSVGAHSFLGMGSLLGRDLPPYVMAGGPEAHPHGLNTEGLRRRGFSPEAVQTLRRGYKILYRQNLTLAQALERLRELVPNCPEMGIMVAFLERSERGIVR